MSMESCRWNLTGLRREWERKSWKCQIWMIVLRSSAVKQAETTSKRWCLLQGDDPSTVPSNLSSCFSVFFVCLFVYFLFCIGVMVINNVVIASGEQRRDSAIHIHVSILPQTLLPSRLPHNIKQGSLCYSVSPCWPSILNTAVCTCPSQPPQLSLPPILHPSNHKFIL